MGWYRHFEKAINILLLPVFELWTVRPRQMITVATKLAIVKGGLGLLAVIPHLFVAMYFCFYGISVLNWSLVR